MIYKLIIIVLGLILLTACKNDKPYEPQFTYVEKASGKKNYYSEVPIYTEMYLMETSQDYKSKSLKKTVDSFFEKKSRICEVDSTINYYSFYIIEKTKCTEKYLIDGEGKDGCWKNDDKEMQNRDYEVFLKLHFKRSSINKKKWISDKFSRKHMISCVE